MNEFVEHVKELLELFAPVMAKRMFGGHGLYCDGRMFAIVADGRLYLKADEDNAGDFERRGLERFGYEKQGKRIELSYWRAPDEMLDDPEEAALWARHAFDAARRASVARMGAPRRRRGNKKPLRGGVS